MQVKYLFVTVVTMSLFVFNANFVMAHQIEYYTENDTEALLEHIQSNADTLTTCTEKKSLDEKLSCYDTICHFTDGDDVTECLKSVVEQLFQNKDTSFVFEYVSQMQDSIEAGGAVFNRHDVGHTVGESIYIKHNGEKKRFSDCPEDGIWDYGCYHGFLIELSLDESQSIEELALDVCDNLSASSKVYACYHGLGHTLILSGNSVHKSLEICDQFSENWLREGCYSGVFMQTHEYRREGIFIEDDIDSVPGLLSFCKSLDDPYKMQCYREIATSLFELHTNDNFEEVIAHCFKVEKGYEAPCLAGLSELAANTVEHASILGVTTYNNVFKDTQRFCDMFPKTYQYICINTAIVNLVDFRSNNNVRILEDEFCGLYHDEQNKNVCTNSIIEYIPVFSVSTEQEKVYVVVFLLCKNRKIVISTYTKNLIC